MVFFRESDLFLSHAKLFLLACRNINTGSVSKTNYIIIIIILLLFIVLGSKLRYDNPTSYFPIFISSAKSSFFFQWLLVHAILNAYFVIHSEDKVISLHNGLLG